MTGPKAERQATPQQSVPAELRDALAGDAAARRHWAQLPPSHRREYVEWVGGAKKEDTRRERAARALEMLVDRKG
jgi:uncharacterized protein YdeI (YjbR/CyaY-like superfamily)